MPPARDKLQRPDQYGYMRDWKLAAMRESPTGFAEVVYDPQAVTLLRRLLEAVAAIAFPPPTTQDVRGEVTVPGVATDATLSKLIAAVRALQVDRPDRMTVQGAVAIDGPVALDAMTLRELADAFPDSLKLTEEDRALLREASSRSTTVRAGGGVPRDVLNAIRDRTMPGEWGYQSGTGGTLALASGVRLVALRVFAPTDGTLTINGGNPITVRAGAGFDWSPAVDLRGVTVAFAAGMDWFAETIT